MSKSRKQDEIDNFVDRHIHKTAGDKAQQKKFDKAEWNWFREQRYRNGRIPAHSQQMERLG